MLRLLVPAVVIVLVGCSQNKLPEVVEKAFEDANQVELLLLNPDAKKLIGKDDPSRIDGWLIIGRTTLSDKESQQMIRDALRKGANQAKKTPDGSFLPRYAIRFQVTNHTVDLVISFENFMATIFVDAKPAGSFILTTDPRLLLNAELETAGVKLPN